jgi:diketogulonate reductase-like aldo/keto reductase
MIGDYRLIIRPGTQKLALSDPKNLESRNGTLKALKELKNNGSIRMIGVSNFLKKHFTDDFMEKGVGSTKGLVEVNQIEFHPLQFTQEIKDLIQFCKEHNIIVQAYSPFGQANLIKCKEIQQISKSLTYSCPPLIVI